jgi:hypothetical protein
MLALGLLVLAGWSFTGGEKDFLVGDDDDVVGPPGAAVGGGDDGPSLRSLSDDQVSLALWLIDSGSWKETFFVFVGHRDLGEEKRKEGGRQYTMSE